MKNIVFFISSSIYEFKNERNEIVAFVAGLDKRYGGDRLRIRCEICENVSDEMREEGTQEEYNRIIREESDVVYVLVGNRAGKYTREEFQVAYQAFRKSHARPRVVVYFRRPEQAEAPEKSAEEFRETVFEKMHHYPAEFTHLDTIKLSILLALTGELGLDLSIRDGRALLGGEEVMSTRNVPSFARNRALQELAAERDRLQEEYDEYLELYQMSKKAVLLRHMEEIQQKLKQTTEQLQRMESDALSLLRQAYETRSTGKRVNPREETALRLLDEGDYEGAKAALRDPAWKQECLQAEEEARLGQLIRDSGLEKIRQYISGQRTLIRTLESSGVSADVGAEIRAIYEEITALAEKYAIELEVFANYAIFLDDQIEFDAGLKVTDRFLHVLKQHPDAADDSLRAGMANVRGILFDRNHDYTAAEKEYREALAICQRMAEKDYAAYERNLAMILNNLANLLKNTNRQKEAEETYCQALKIQRRMTEKNPGDIYQQGLAMILNNLANLFGDSHRPKEAEETHREALEIRRRLAEKNPDAYESDLAASMNNLANVLKGTDRLKDAENLYWQALEIYRRLAKKNPGAYEVKLVNPLNNLANLLKKTGQLKEAEELHRQGLEILQRLAEKNPNVYEPSLAASLNNLAALLLDTGSVAEAEKLYRQALEIYRRLAENNFDAYKRYLEVILENLIKLLNNNGREAETGPLIEEWLKVRFSPTEPELANRLNERAIQAMKAGENAKSEALYRQALEIRRRLYRQNSEAFGADLATTAGNLAMLLHYNHREAEAEALYREELAIVRKLVKQDVNKWQFILHLNLTSLAQVLESTGRKEEAAALRQEAQQVFSGK